MSPLTNSQGLPHPIFLAVQNDSYTDGGADISVTRLISPPQIVVLTERHGQSIVVDVADRLWPLMGQLMHLLLERAIGKDNPNYLVEERMMVEIELIKHGPVKFSGQMDLYNKQEECLQDYKFVGEYSAKMALEGNKKEWEEQLNVLRWLLFRTKKILAKKLEIVCVLRDHGSRSKLPPSVTIPYKVWDIEEANIFVQKRLYAHMDAKKMPDIALPPCTPEETWGGRRCVKWCGAAEFCHQIKGEK